MVSNQTSNLGDWHYSVIKSDRETEVPNGGGHLSRDKISCDNSLLSNSINEFYKSNYMNESMNKISRNSSRE